MKVFSVLLILAGILYFGLSQFSYTTEETLVDIGPFEAKKQTEQQIPYSPLLAGGLVVGGSIILAASTLKEAKAS